ncbi:MAG: hypothetical protein V1904_03765 [Bacteroidota bacterium]
MKKLFIFFTAFLLLTLAEISIAQIPVVPPQAFSYQAILRNNMGNPLPNQTVSLKFSIIDTVYGIKYIETHDTITNQFGLLTVEIGRGITLFGSFDSIFWGHNDHYLKTEIDTTGSGSYTTMGTSQLISVPYAMYAQYAGPWLILDTGPPGQFLPPSMICFLGNESLGYPSPQVAIGTTTPDPSAILELCSSDQGVLIPRLTTVQMNYLGAIAANSLLIFNIDSNRFCYYEVGPPPTIPHWAVIPTTNDLQSIQLWQYSGGNLYYNFGNVGIGTSTPQAPLQISTGDVYIENIGSGVIMKSPNGNCWRMTVDDTGNPVSTQITCP